MNYRLLLLILMMCCAMGSLSASKLDSLRTEKIKGKKYIIHRVEPKETLFSITRRYNVTVEELKKQNPALENGLKMYDELRIPVAKKKNKKNETVAVAADSSIHIVQQGETLFAISRMYNLSVDSLRKINSLESANLSIGDTLRLSPVMEVEAEEVVASANDSLKYHTVEPKETLFSISRLYQVEIEDLQEWNRLTDYNLSIGQKLLIGQADGVDKSTDSLSVIETNSKVDSTTQKPEIPVLDTLYVKTDNSQFKTRTKTVEGRKRTVEEGFAMKIEDTDYTKKFLALHRTAPLGSTILVKNQMNNVTIEARVVGKLPESALNIKLLMRLSSAAYKALGAIDLKTPVTVSYHEDE